MQSKIVPPLRLTDEQSDALAARETAVALDAGAGCGKTFVLTERFLGELEPLSEDAPPVDLEEVVAITFTDAAAREMRGRIRRKCLDRLKTDSDSGDYWLRLLRTLDSARVGTIHAFCGETVRAHAMELGIDPGFRVLDQAMADVLRSQATDTCLRQRLEQRDERTLNLAAEYGVAGLKKRLHLLQDENASRHLPDWLEKSPENVVARWRDFFQTTIWPQGLAILSKRPEIQQLLETIPQARPSARAEAAFEELQEKLHEVLAGSADAARLARIDALARVKGVCAKSDWPSAELYAIYRDASTALRRAIGKQGAMASAGDLERAAELGLSMGHIALAVRDEYALAKRSVAALDFDDLLFEARRLLTDPTFGEIQRRLRNRVRLLLVDEFQDTNVQQMEIVRALVGEDLERLGLFFVGDFKQSIYRFRGAEPAVFRNLQEETPVAGRLPLTMNFRSQPAILDFVNALFEPRFPGVYAPLRPARSQVTPRPGVEFLWTPAPAASSTPEQRQAEARRIAERLRAMLDRGEEVVAESVEGKESPRPVRQGDIVLLFRALSDVQHYEEALRNAEIAHHLIGGHAFYSQQEVYDVLNLMRAIASTCDEISLAGVLRSPFFSLHDQSLFALVQGSGSLNAGLSDRKALDALTPEERRRAKRAAKVLSELRELKGTLGSCDLVRRAIDKTGYDAVLLSEFLGERKLANLEKLLEQARTVDEGQGRNVDAFVRQLSEFTVRRPKEALAGTTSDADDVVRLMTIHHAKGLEFPVVVLPDLGRLSRNEAAAATFHPALGPLVSPQSSDAGKGLVGLDLANKFSEVENGEELDRLFYVAATRAADRLILSGVVEDLARRPKGPWLSTLADRFDLATGQLQGELPEGYGEPQVEVVSLGEMSDRSSTGKSRRPDFAKLLEKARQPPGDNRAFEGVAPIAVVSSDLRRFSVSRLTGKLHRRQGFRDEEATSTHSKNLIDPIGFGRLVHAVLERIDFGDPRNIDSWCESLAPLHLRRHIDQATEEAASLVRRFLSSKRCQKLRDARRVEREVEFLLRLPARKNEAKGVLLQGYLDCLYQDARGDWWLLDYKTNQVESSGIAELADHYRLQMNVYGLAVEESFGASLVGSHLHFLRPGLEAEFAWDSAAKARAQALVSEAIESARTATCPTAPHL